jgi:hypothetical protein
VVVILAVVAGPVLPAFDPTFEPSVKLVVTTLLYSRMPMHQAAAAPDVTVTVTVLAPAVATAMFCAT